MDSSEELDRRHTTGTHYSTVPVPVVIVLLVAGHETAPAM